MTRILALVVTLSCGAVLARPQGIEWQTDPEKAISLAKQARKPLMVYVLGSTEDRDEDIERGQRRALADPRVLAQARRFVPLKISRVRHRDLLKQFGFAERANLEIAFISFDGSKLDPQPLSANGVANADTLAQKMALVFDFYRQRLFDAALRPVLENKEAKPTELRAALEQVRELNIVGADASIAALLDREGLDPKVATLAVDVLAQLSTKVAVEKLISRARDGDARAAEALGKCTPAGAELMLDHLYVRQGDKAEFNPDVYRAVAKICKIANVKADRWWENAKPAMAEAEIKRVTDLVRSYAARWKAQNADR